MCTRAPRPTPALTTAAYRTRAPTCTTLKAAVGFLTAGGACLSAHRLSLLRPTPTVKVAAARRALSSSKTRLQCLYRLTGLRTAGCTRCRASLKETFSRPSMRWRRSRKLVAHHLHRHCLRWALCLCLPPLPHRRLLRCQHCPFCRRLLQSLLHLHQHCHLTTVAWFRQRALNACHSSLRASSCCQPNAAQNA